MLALYLAYLDDESDKKLFEEIYLSHRKQMVILAITILGSEDDAQEDVYKRQVYKHIGVGLCLLYRTDGYNSATALFLHIRHCRLYKH